SIMCVFSFHAEDGIRDFHVTGVQTCALPISLPGSFNLGISFPVGEKVDIAADATIIGCDIYKELVFDYHDNTPVLTDTRQTKNYENGFSGKVGLNYQTNDKLALRAGAGYVYTPVRGPFVSPETPDNNRLMGSIGFTYDINDKWDITGAYVLQHLAERTVSNAETGLTGAYETYIHAPGLSLTYKW